jgi:transcriptional regulator with XRE-family HTH domain
MVENQIKNEFLRQFGEKLGEVRKLKGLSYRKLDENCSLDYSYISKIEKGEVNVTLETILELLKGLNSQPKELFDFVIELD